MIERTIECTFKMRAIDLLLSLAYMYIFNDNKIVSQYENVLL